MVTKKMSKASAPKYHRWYDYNPRLATQLDVMGHLNPHELHTVLRGIMKIMQKQAPVLTEGVVFGIHPRRRWYDRDYHAWFIINSLKYARLSIMINVIDYIGNVLSQVVPQKS